MGLPRGKHWAAAAPKAMLIGGGLRAMRWPHCTARALLLSGLGALGLTCPKPELKPGKGGFSMGAPSRLPGPAPWTCLDQGCQQ